MEQKKATKGRDENYEKSRKPEEEEAKTADEHALLKGLQGKKFPIIKNVTHIMGEIVMDNDLFYLLTGDDCEDYILASPLQFDASLRVKEYMDRTNGGFQLPQDVVEAIHRRGHVSEEDHQKLGIPLTHIKFTGYDFIIPKCELKEILCDLEVKRVKDNIPLYLVQDIANQKVVVTRDFLRTNYPDQYGEFVFGKHSIDYKTGQSFRPVI